jgi:hypothetical protein
MATTNESDPRHHIEKMQARLKETIDHLRFDIDKVSEPQLRAMFETAAEVLTGLKKGNCSRPGACFGHAAHGIGRPSRVRRIASMARIDLRRAVSTTDLMSA